MNFFQSIIAAYAQLGRDCSTWLDEEAEKEQTHAIIFETLDRQIREARQEK